MSSVVSCVENIPVQSLPCATRFYYNRSSTCLTQTKKSVHEAPTSDTPKIFLLPNTKIMRVLITLLLLAISPSASETFVIRGSDNVNEEWVCTDSTQLFDGVRPSMSWFCPTIHDTPKLKIRQASVCRLGSTYHACANTQIQTCGSAYKEALDPALHPETRQHFMAFDQACVGGLFPEVGDTCVTADAIQCTVEKRVVGVLKDVSESETVNMGSRDVTSRTGSPNAPPTPPHPNAPPLVDETITYYYFIWLLPVILVVVSITTYIFVCALANNNRYIRCPNMLKFEWMKQEDIPISVPKAVNSAPPKEAPKTTSTVNDAAVSRATRALEVRRNERLMQLQQNRR